MAYHKLQNVIATDLYHTNCVGFIPQIDDAVVILGEVQRLAWASKNPNSGTITVFLMSSWWFSRFLEA